MENNDICRLKLLHVHGGSCSNTETLIFVLVRNFISTFMLKTTYQWWISHGKDNHTSVLRSIVCNSTQMCFHDMVAIQKGHLTIRLDPNLVLKFKKINILHTFFVILFLNTLAYCAKWSRAVIWSLNLPVFVNLPKQTPTEPSWSRPTLTAILIIDSLIPKSASKHYIQHVLYSGLLYLR